MLRDWQETSFPAIDKSNEVKLTLNDDHKENIENQRFPTSVKKVDKAKRRESFFLKSRSVLNSLVGSPVGEKQKDEHQKCDDYSNVLTSTLHQKQESDENSQSHFLDDKPPNNQNENKEALGVIAHINKTSNDSSNNQCEELSVTTHDCQNESANTEIDDSSHGFQKLDSAESSANASFHSTQSHSSHLFEPTASSLARTTHGPSRAHKSENESVYNKKLISSTDIELKKIEEARKNIKKMRTQNMKALKKEHLKAENGPQKVGFVCSSKPLTVAHSPKFHKMHNEYHPKDHLNHEPAKKATFKWKNLLTAPKSPKLATRIRAMTHPKAQPMSREEKENLEFEEQKKHQFKALEYKKGSAGLWGEAGVSRHIASNRPLTMPKPFKFATNSRLRAANIKALRKSPICSKIKTVQKLGNKVFLGRRLTRPKSPKFATKMRSSHRPNIKSSEEIQMEEMKHQFKALKRPDLNKRQKNRSSKKSTQAQSFNLTQPEPFKLCTEERGETKAKMFRDKVFDEERLALESMEVHALPMPRVSGSGFIPKHSAKNLTETKDFNLIGLERHLVEQARFKQKITQEKEVEEKNRHFKPIKLPGTTFEPGNLPKPVTRHSTVPLNISSRTKERAFQREIFDSNVAKRKEQKKENERIESLKRKAEFDKITQELRKMPACNGGHMFIARPITRSFGKRTKIAPPKPLTQPKSPDFATEKRALFRNHTKRL